jgi:hypothetical protein
MAPAVAGLVDGFREDLFSNARFAEQQHRGVRRGDEPRMRQGTPNGFTSVNDPVVNLNAGHVAAHDAAIIDRLI